MKGRRDEAVANGTANVRASNVIAYAVDPLLVGGWRELIDDIMPSEHGFEIAIRRPNAMHAMLCWVLFAFDAGFRQARETPANVLVRLEDQRLQSALGEVEGGGESGNSAANVDDVMVFVH
jgi:hypothetical protein